MIGTILEVYKARESEGLWVMLLVIVSYVQGAKGNKGVSYYTRHYEATLSRCSV